MGPHDSAYKSLFSYPYLVECLIRGFVPGEWIDRLDFKTLGTVSEAHPRDNLDIRYDDMIWRLRWRGTRRWIYVYLMLEFQSTDEPFMAVRMLDYEGGLYHQLVRSLGLRRGDLLPVVLPVVIFRGYPAWRSATEVFDLIEPAPAEVEPYQPHLKFLLLDVNAYPPVELEAMPNPVACMFRLERSPTLGTAAIDDLDDLLSDPEHAGLRRAFALWLTQVLLPSRLPGVTVPIVKKLEEVSAMIAEHAIDWTAQWRKEGEAAGIRKGEAAGIRKGEAAVLLRLLTRRYGSLDRGVEERVRSADAEQLLEWADRFVTAETLDEVFDGSP